MIDMILVLLFFFGLTVLCVALFRSSSKQRRWREGPNDMRRSDGADAGEPYDRKKAYRAAQDASNWGGPT